MPFVASPDGVRIHYQVDGDGPAIVLHHGFGSSPERWRWEGYVDALRDSYRLILIAARGHGESDRPHDPEAYSWPRRVDDVCAVMNAEGLAKAVFWGYSMGGRTAFAMLRYAPERLLAAIIGGSDPYPRDPGSYEQRIELLSQGMDVYIANLERQTGAPLPPARRAHYESSDPKAWVALLRAYASADDLAEGLEQLETPTLLYSGTEDEPHDGARRAASLMPNASFASLEGLTHRLAVERSDLVLPHVRTFLEQVLSGSVAAR